MQLRPERGAIALLEPQFLMCVRRCPTLPHSLGCSTIGAVGLSFRVRDGTGRFPHAMTAVTLLTTPQQTNTGGVGNLNWPWVHDFTIQLSNYSICNSTVRTTTTTTRTAMITAAAGCCWCGHRTVPPQHVLGVVGFVVWGPPSGREHA